VKHKPLVPKLTRHNFVTKTRAWPFHAFSGMAIALTIFTTNSAIDAISAVDDTIVFTQREDSAAATNGLR
jgi:hypothetical protein